MASYTTYSFLTTSGSLPPKPAGNDLINLGAGGAFTALNGELWIIDPTTPGWTSLDAGDIATANAIAIAVGVGGPAGTLATDVRFLGHEGLDLCKSHIKAGVSIPTCGLPQVLGFYFACTHFNETYTLQIELDDSYVRSNYGFNERAKYIYSINTSDLPCDTCTAEHNANEVACRFRDIINGKFNDGDPTKITHFQRADIENQYQPFKAVVMQDNWFSFPLTLGTSDEAPCNGCVIIGGITGIEFNDGSGDTEFTNTVNPLDGGTTLPGQLKRIVALINAELEPSGGFAWLSRGVGPCCPYTLNVMTCYDDFAIVVDDGSETGSVTVESVDPFHTFTTDPYCPDCSSEATSVTPTSGLLLFAEPLELPCDCQYPPNLPVPNYYGRTLQVYPVGGGWTNGQTWTYELQAQVLPAGFGYFWQDKERYQHNGGHGKNFRYSRTLRGTIPQPDAQSAVSNVLTKCDETYCVYDLIITTNVRGKNNNGLTYSNQDLGFVLIPFADTATSGPWETLLDAMRDRGICDTGGNISCHPG